MRKLLTGVIVFCAFVGGYAANIMSDHIDGNKNLTGWTRSSTTYAAYYTGSFKNGTAALRVRKTAYATKTVSTKGYSGIKLAFKLAAYSLENDEYVAVQYNTGSGWVEAGRRVNGEDKGSYHAFSVSLPAAADDNASLKIRVRIYGSSSYDYGYLDDIVVSGTKNVTATPSGELTIYADSFDGGTSGVPGWKRSNKSYVQRYMGSIKKGSAALRLRKSNQAVTYLKVSPFKNMKLHFKLAAYSLEGSEYIACEYRLDNGSWQTAGRLANGEDNKVFHSYSVSIPNGTILEIRFRMSANSKYDYGYVDDLKVTGERK